MIKSFTLDMCGVCLLWHSGLGVCELSCSTKQTYLLVYLSLMKQQLVITRAIHQTDISSLLDSWVTNTSFIKCCHHKTNCSSICCHKNITCLSGGLLRVCQVFFCLCKIMYQGVITNCLFMSVMFYLMMLSVA
jgi:hypothetical protein